MDYHDIDRFKQNFTATSLVQPGGWVPILPASPWIDAGQLARAENSRRASCGLGEASKAENTCEAGQQNRSRLGVGRSVITMQMFRGAPVLGRIGPLKTIAHQSCNCPPLFRTSIRKRGAVKRSSRSTVPRGCAAEHAQPSGVRSPHPINSLAERTAAEQGSAAVHGA